MKIPEGEYWYYFQGGPNEGYIYKSIDLLVEGQGFSGYNDSYGIPGAYYFRGEVSNGLHVVVWKKFDWELNGQQG